MLDGKCFTEVPIRGLKEAAEDGEAEDDEPDDVDEEEGLAGDEAGAAVADLAEPQLRHGDPGARRLDAPAPVGHPVGAAHGVGAEAVDGTGRGGPVGGRGAEVGPDVGSDPDGEEKQEEEEEEEGEGFRGGWRH